jgi:hypothetical protein
MALTTLIARLTLVTLKAIRGTTVTTLIARLTLVTLKAWSNAGSDPLLEFFDSQF